MANHDVTDRTLELLKGMNALKDLDLDNTQVTDAGLKILKDLPALNALHLRNTRITDQGFQEELATKESLQQLDLAGTQVSRETAEAWRKAKDGRRVLR
jgi:Leucine-rich repeat (LRR) protein